MKKITKEVTYEIHGRHGTAYLRINIDGAEEAWVNFEEILSVVKETADKIEESLKGISFEAQEP
jgi:heme oxygenase